MRQWRLIYDTPASGSVNMARDEAILDAVSSGAAPPTLRLYRWHPACLSLGYGQRVAEVDTGRLEAFGWTLVRRPTGGRAILHTDELTYSLALPVDHPLATGGVVESYQRISEALLMGLAQLGAEAQAQPKATDAAFGAVCFETPSHYEITVDGKKLVGSAQVRRKTGVLQHGTLPLVGDITRICEALRYDDEAEREAAKAQVRARATTLQQVLGLFVSLSDKHAVQPDNVGAGLRPAPTTAHTSEMEGSLWIQAADAVVQGFETAFGITFEPGELNTAEQDEAVALVNDKYGNAAWSMRR